MLVGVVDARVQQGGGRHRVRHQFMHRLLMMKLLGKTLFTQCMTDIPILLQKTSKYNRLLHFLLLNILSLWFVIVNIQKENVFDCNSSLRFAFLWPTCSGMTRTEGRVGRRRWEGGRRGPGPK